MNRRIKPLKFETFIELLSLVQNSHYVRNEPIPSDNVNINLLESALNNPFQKFGGVYLYRGFIRKASILFYGLIKNHSLSNGNKRMACIALAYFCYLNHYDFKIPMEDFYSLAKFVSESMPQEDEKCKAKIYSILKKYVRPAK